MKNVFHERKKITQDIARQVNGTDAQGNLKDPTYHYEEFTNSRAFRYGIWDVGGSLVHFFFFNFCIFQYRKFVLKFSKRRRGERGQRFIGI